jgi:predicted DNA-binding transcriptional regulator AlpA
MKNELQNNNAPRPAIERIPTAARRMGVSISQTYREIKAGRLGPLVKLGERASGLPSAAVDAWIMSKITDAQGGA